MGKPHYTREMVTGLYSALAKHAFSLALRRLIMDKSLTDEEKKIASAAMEKARALPGFFTKSFLIYLSNGIIDAKDRRKMEPIKDQLFLELGVRLLSANLENRIDLRISQDTFCLGLNRIIPACVSFSKDGLCYAFKTEKGEILANKGTEYAITRDIDLLLEDKNPYNINNDHPDAPKFASYDLGGVPREKWTIQFRNAYALIKEKVPHIYDEVYPFLDAVVPHGYTIHKQSSSSYSKSPGILYLSYTDDDITQAEAVIHEVNHTIFNIISWKHKLHDNDDELKYYSAYRPDARHFRGCFLGLHAFAAVQSFYSSLAEMDRNEMHVEKFLFFYLKNRKVVELMDKYGKFTPEGMMLFDDVRNRHKSDDDFFLRCKDEHPLLVARMEERVAFHLEEAKKKNAVLLH
jgi:hypothetical protein